MNYKKRRVRFPIIDRGLVRRELGGSAQCLSVWQNRATATLVRQMVRAARPLNAPAESGRGALS